MEVDDRVYHECMQLTSQFKFCPNAFRVDMYRGCDFGCKYCFANMEAFNEVGTGLSQWREAKISDVKAKFKLALETDKESKSTVVELLRHRVPLHCGGMSDPFQSREWDLGLTKELIKISNEYNYPIMFSTKTNSLPNDYYKLLNPEIHAFQVSIMGWSNEYIKKWESNTASAQSRAEFVQLLRNDFNIWCGVRIQPIIDVEECAKLMYMLEDIPSYYSLEHLHIMSDSFPAIKAVMDNKLDMSQFVSIGGVTEVRHDIKEQNIKRLTLIANKYGIKVGAADNDLHYMSQSRCCCGIDTINPNFDNYLKFNSTYLSTGDSNVADLFIPKSNIRRHMNVGKGIPTVYVEDVVKNYIKKNPKLIPETYRTSVETQLFGTSKYKLF